MQYSGIDVSESQKKINWESVSKNKINFAMIRTSFSLSGVDTEFINNITNISQTNIYPGAYHECTSNNVKDAKNEAIHFLSTVAPYKFYYPLALKLDNEISLLTSKQLVTDIIIAFTDTIKSAGYYPILYAKIDFLKNHTQLNKLQKLDIWLSDFTSNINSGPSYSNKVTIWQHSSRGNISGINTKVNLDISFIDYPELIRRNAMNHLNTTQNNNTQSTSFESEETEPTFYTVMPKDTLRTIAQKLLNDPEKYLEIMELNGLTNTNIVPNQVLRIPSIRKDILLYRVKPGDTLWHLSTIFLESGPRYNEIMRLNGLTSDMIYPGQILKIPNEKQKNMPQTYTVKKGDTLWSIAKNFLGNGQRYTQIMILNNLENGNLRVGQVLYLPKN